MLFLKSADNSPTGRPEWCEKSFNILAGKTKPTDDDKDAIGLSLNSNYEKLSEDEKREFRSKIRCFPQLHTPHKIRFTSLVDQLGNLVRCLPLINKIKAGSNGQIDNAHLITNDFDHEFLILLFKFFETIKLKIKIFDGGCDIGKSFFD